MTKKYFKKILVQNPKDLQIISALSAESTAKVSDIKYLSKNKIFILSVDRKDKENNDDPINSIIKFSFIDACKSKNVDQKNPEKVLKLITIDVFKKNHNYEIILLFSENSYISLESEIIDAELVDQSKVEWLRF